MSTGAIFELKYTPKCACGRGFAPAPLPRASSWFSGGRFAAGEDRREKGGKEGKGRGAFPTSFYNLTTDGFCVFLIKHRPLLEAVRSHMQFAATRST